MATKMSRLFEDIVTDLLERPFKSQAVRFVWDFVSLLVFLFVKFIGKSKGIYCVSLCFTEFTAPVFTTDGEFDIPTLRRVREIVTTQKD